MDESGKKEAMKLSFFAVMAFGLVCCLLYGTGAGIRCNVGILLNPLAAQYGVGYDDISFCIAVMQLMFGASQPFFGVLASKKSNRFVLGLGAVLLALGMLGMATTRSYPLLMISLGLLFGAGTGAVSFGLVLQSAIHFVGVKNAMTISGMLNAAAGLLGFVLAPLMQTLLDMFGLAITLVILLVFALLLIPVVFLVTSHDPRRLASGEKGEDEEPEQPVGELLREAFHNKTFRLLVCGFGTCGFHMVIIESHLFSQFVGYGIEESLASWVFSVYSLATILGALLSGYLSNRLHKGRLLGFYYGFRAIWVLAYLFLMPKNIFTAVLFGIGLGFTGDATVSPTSGLVHNNFRLAQTATLIGVLFLCHQVGAFFSAWLGGVLVQTTGDYTAIWLMDVALCTFASLMSLRIPKDE